MGSPGDLVQRLLSRSDLGARIVHRQRVEPRAAVHAEPASPLPRRLAEALTARGISSLYRHQARGLDLARAGRDVLSVTPTASGKTLSFALPVFESFLSRPRSRALFLYPTKALAQDQFAELRALAAGLGALDPLRIAIYDGDTPATLRRKIKADPPHVILTNPDMLHMGILAHHRDWEPFLRDLRFVVLDELHVYRGIFGSHVHQILARLRRLCKRYGARPQFMAASATVGNPSEFAHGLVGRPFDVVAESGAARAGLEVLFVNPSGVSPYSVAVKLVAEAIRGGLRTIAFTKARRITELLYTWLVQQEPGLRDRVAPYRAGYLPEERRALEARLFSGQLDAVLTTSALELGIDVGALDACVLVGYPGSLISSWQRIGRVGREREGLAILVAMPDALDQYVAHHPELFFGQAFERAVLDPWNAPVASKHLVCAAAEEPLERDELDGWGERSHAVARALVEDGRLAQDAGGDRWFAFRRRPHRDVSPRSAGQPFTILAARSGKELGRIDGIRVYHECHPGAIYLHGGRSYEVLELDSERRQVRIEPVRADHYTVVLGDKETAILERLEARKLGAHPVGLGRLEVTVRIREYQKRRLFGGEPISTHPLDLPPLVYETIGLWIELPGRLPAAFAERGLHFMGGIHAVEHAVIGLFPLLAIADRGDVGGISYTGHPQTGGPAIFVYDGVAGGAGLAEQGFRDLESLLARTAELIQSCPCDEGCPGCIQSPNCGNGNKPLDKQAARLALDCLLGRIALESLSVAPVAAPAEIRPVAAPAADRLPRRQGIRRAGNVEPGVAGVVDGAVALAGASVRGGRGADGSVPAGRLLVLDVETQRSADDVGGWNRVDRMGLALAVVYDGRDSVYRTYYEADVHRLLLDLVMADQVVGFNIDRFDLTVLAGYTDWDLGRIRTLDLLSEIHRQIGFRITLNRLSEANLGRSKAGGGLQSLRWWKEGRIDLVEQYCRQDVEMTLRLYELGQARGYLLYRDREARTLRVPVRW